MDFDFIKKLIQDKIEDAHIRVSDMRGTGDHLELLVVSDHFRGKSLLDQHRIIMDILNEELKGDLHAVQIKTLTYEKAKNITIEETGP